MNINQKRTVQVDVTELRLHINIETGQITNWRKPNTEQLEALLSGESADD